MSLRNLCTLCVLFLFVASPTLAAQSAPDVVRGRVLDDSSRALSGAAVTITRGPDRLVQTATTDADGRYNSRFEQGTGDYLVHVAATGFRAARRRVQRVSNERELVADFTLGRDLTLLAAVKVKADKPERASNSASPYDVEPGASEKWSDGVNGRLLPGSAGDLTALAGTMPGITLTPGGPSMLGAASSSNLTTLNGMALPGGSLPRAAKLDTRVTGATYDPTRGGFSGANIDTRLSAGSRSFQERNAYLTFDAPALQATDLVGRSLGLINRGYRASLGADGEAIRRALTYNVSLDVSSTLNDPATLLSASTDTWQRAGVSPDSIARLRTVATQLGLPVGGSFAPTVRRRDAISWLGRLDDVRDSLRTLTLTTYLSNSNAGALSYGPLTAPTAGGEQTDRTMGLQFMHSQYVGAGHFVLTQNKLSASRVHQTATPYLSAPAASVLVRSASDAASNDVASLQLGGNPWLVTDDARWTVEGSNETIWMKRGSKHRFKAQLWAREDGLEQVGKPNALGAYTFNSLADFAANRPASYSRTITQPDRRAATTNGALAFAHQWNKSRWFSMLYGARVEANAFGENPPLNSALDAALGVRSGIAPSRVHVSPRLGFSYTYSRSKDNGNGSHGSELGTFYRNTMGFIRGGIGEFRDLYRPGMLADAMVGSGLAGSTLSLSCVGAAAPIPDWPTLVSAAASLPTTCADGEGALAERAPSVTLVDPTFDAPRSWRASLNLGTTVGTFILKMDALGSYDLSQPSTLDANFSGTSRFTLNGEGGRPVYVTPAAIDVASGSVSAAESRRSSAFGRVSQRTSDLRGYGGQLTTTLMPDVFRFRSRVSMFGSVAYTLQSLKSQVRGFDGATFGDPRTREWATGNNDARHAFVIQAGIAVPKVGAFTFYSRLQSGLPFTPLVQGDINGDGRANDRAFIPALSTTADANPASADAQLRALLAASPSSVRDCITRQLGAVAGRNSCRGAWTQQLNMQWSPQLPIKVQGRNIEAHVVFDNLLGGLDQLAHGGNNLRGWGAGGAPDPVLLMPRSFDAGTGRFRYDVNPRFGDTRAVRTLNRAPFRVTMDFSLDFSVPYDMQQLRRALEPVKTKQGWERRSADSIAAVYMQGTSNIHRLLLAESDSLFLGSDQIARLMVADSIYGARVRAIYFPLGQFLATQPEGKPGKAALDSVQASTKLFWPVFWEQADVVDSIVTRQQKELMPMLKNLTETTKEQRKNSKWFFGFPVPMVHNKPKVGSN